MDNALIKDNDVDYKLWENKAAGYLKSLCEQMNKKTYITKLTNDIECWKKSHVYKHSLMASFFGKNKKSAPKGYRAYLQWLNHTGKLDDYLDRSISYIFMRDLGKSLDCEETKTRIKSVVEDLKNNIINTKEKKSEESKGMAMLYRKAEEEGIELTLIWLIDKLKTVSKNIPKGMDAEEAKRKLIKIIAGVVMHQVEEMKDNISKTERAEKLNAAIRLGYCYGLTYPFIDDLLDSKVLSSKEKSQYSDLIRKTLTTTEVAELKNWDGENGELIKYIHSELKEAFEYIKGYQSEETIESFFKHSYIFFNSQEEDRIKDLSNPHYTNEEIYVPIILKSSASRLIIRSVISASEDNGFENRTFFYGIYNQLADDFTDMFIDMENESVTPYTYYIKYHNIREDLINPFELYWTVISNLIHNVYKSDYKTCEVILSRAINSLKRLKMRVGIEKYNEIMNMFGFENTKFSNLIQKVVGKAENVDFFDKLIRDYMVETLRNQENEKEKFSNTIRTMQEEINSVLNISKTTTNSYMKEIIKEAANYSLEGDGKRLRPIMAWDIGTNGYGLNKAHMMPLLKSLEYMHTASLVFDDLPSQDNASMRRGRRTLHKEYNVAIAELTGLFLTQKAIEEQTYLEEFNSKTVLKLIRYSSQITEKMCTGQAMDLESKSNKLSIEELKIMCFYKTGIAFEASLVMPAILGNAKESEIEALQRFAYYAGIAFQIKDDVLDAEGDSKILGKVAGKDAENETSTFVTILGIDNAKREMWQHYCNAMDELKKIPRNITFLKNLMDYVISRDK